MKRKCWVFINVYVAGIVSPLYNIYTITNKVRLNAILNIVSGILSTLLVLLFLKTTNWGVYVIVGISTIIGLLKGFLIIPVYAASCLKQKCLTFVEPILKYNLTTLVMIGVFYLISLILTPNSWIIFILSVLICGIFGLIINYFMLLNREERKFINDFLLKMRGEFKWKKMI